MKPIRPLDPGLVNKIAAGEVVERPLSVVKELVENAIDAGASIITVEIREGGLTSIRVTDNGSGIPAEELSIAFMQHATSKIQALEDLFAIMTMGFRGEALASIAAVSQVEIITKTAQALSGTRLELHGGEEVARQEIGCATGTTLIVSNLFYNTPARRKFLKKPATEAGYITGLMEKLAMGHPGLTFRYINNGKQILATNGNGDLKTAMLYVYDRAMTQKLISVQADDGALALDGYVGKPETARGNRGYGHFYLNNRYIKSELLQSAVEEAAKTMLMTGKFPVYTLHLHIAPDKVDVNVHPNKMDVRFSDEEGVFTFVRDAVHSALSDSSLVPEVTLKPNRAERPLPDHWAYEAEEIPLIDSTPVRLNAPPWEPVLSLPNVPTRGSAPSLPNAPITQKDSDEFVLSETPVRKAEAVPSRAFFKDYAIVGQLFKTYWLITHGDSIYLIDQHAAHERVLYEDIIEKMQRESVYAQTLLEPVPLRLTQRENQVLRDHLPLLQRFGYAFTETAEDAFAITAVPFIFKEPAGFSFFAELLDKLESVGAKEGELYAYKRDSIAMISCKAAVKAQDALVEAEARSLIVRLLALDNPFTCPHGRPTVIEITRRELERRFKRVT